MDPRTLNEASKINEFVNDLYSILIELDSLDEVKSINVTDKNQKTLTITANGASSTEVHGILRSYIREKLKMAKEELDKIIPSKASVVNAIETAIRTKTERNWEKTYWFFDIHGTVLKPTYKSDDICREFYPYAKQIMQVLSQREDIVMILYTCSHLDEIQQYLDFFKDNGIKFAYVNENPDVENSKYGFFDNKPYMNVLFEDKAGFNPETDWVSTHLCLLENGMWPKNLEVKNG
jgi:hypothetical protein